MRNTLSSKPCSIIQISTQPTSRGVAQDSKIGLECLLQIFLRNQSLLTHLNPLVQFPKHSLFGSFTQCTIVRKRNITKKINTSMVFSYCDFARMQLELEMVVKKILYFRNQFFQKILVLGHNDKIIRIADIVFDFQFSFHKLIKLIHIDIGKKLRSQIANRKPLSSKKIGGFTNKAFDYFFRKPQNISIFDFPPQQLNQNSVINAIKKLPNIALERIRCSAMILGNFSKHCIQDLNTLMGSFSNTTGKGMGYKSRLKNWVKDFKNCMMQYSIQNRCFVNMPKLRVVNVKITIRSMLVGFA